MASFPVEIYRRRALIGQLALGDFRARYSGSLLGFFWAFVQPLLTIVMYLFINRVGFRPVPLGGVPFVLWLIAGFVPWFYFADGMIAATNSLVEYSYLVKKTVFDVALVPVIKLASVALTHIVVLGVVMIIVAVSGYWPRLSWLQIPYYLIALAALLSGIASITSAITVFVRDLAQIVTVSMQFIFWLTPVAWSLSNAPPKYVPILEMNPLHYLVDGMRDSLLMGRWFWEKPVQSVVFWVVAIGLNLAGWTMFRRLRPHFADVL